MLDLDDIRHVWETGPAFGALNVDILALREHGRELCV